MTDEEIKNTILKELAGELFEWHDPDDGIKGSGFLNVSLSSIVAKIGEEEFVIKKFINDMILEGYVKESAVTQKDYHYKITDEGFFFLKRKGGYQPEPGGPHYIPLPPESSKSISDRILGFFKSKWIKIIGLIVLGLSAILYLLKLIFDVFNLKN